jgi:hypothetical protein
MEKIVFSSKLEKVNLAIFIIVFIGGVIASGIINNVINNDSEYLLKTIFFIIILAFFLILRLISVIKIMLFESNVQVQYCKLIFWEKPKKFAYDEIEKVGYHTFPIIYQPPILKIYLKNGNTFKFNVRNINDNSLQKVIEILKSYGIESNEFDNIKW